MTPLLQETADGRTVIFGPGALAAARDLLGTGFTLLTTPRAAAAAPDAVARARTMVQVPDGLVEEAAAALRGMVGGEQIVALGGGRVIDVAKALAAADPPRTVVAIPTTLSGAEMTGVHRHASGVAARTPRVRPAVVVNDPALSASQPVPRLAASSANALGHAVVAISSPHATAASTAWAGEAVTRFGGAWARPAEPERAQLALGALRAGAAVDATGLGLHHVLSQTAVRTAGLGHAQANAALLPASLRALRNRRPEPLAAVETSAGIDLDVLAGLLARIADTGALSALASDEALLERTVESARARPELARIPPPPDRDELRTLYRDAARAAERVSRPAGGNGAR